MIQTFEAVTDAAGQVRLPAGAQVPAGRRVVVVVLDEATPHELSLLSEQVLARDWLRPEEDEAWAEYQPGR